MVKYYKLIDKERNLVNYIEIIGDNFAPFYNVEAMINTYCNNQFDLFEITKQEFTKKSLDVIANKIPVIENTR